MSREAITLEKLIIRLKGKEISEPIDISASDGELGKLIAKLRGSGRKQEVELAKLFPPERIEQIKKKELRRYKAAQDKKWENWLEGVSR